MLGLFYRTDFDCGGLLPTCCIHVALWLNPCRYNAPVEFGVFTNVYGVYSFWHIFATLFNI